MMMSNQATAAATAASSKRKYDEAFKTNALKMIDNGQAVRSVAQSLGVGENLLHKWKAARQQHAPALELENAELRAKVRQLEMERDILKKSLEHFLPLAKEPRYELLDKQLPAFPVRLACRLLGLERSSFYRWRQAREVAEAPAAALAEAVREVFWEHARCYGARHLWAELRARGWPVGRRRVRRAMAELGLQAIQCYGSMSNRV
jgi:transposase-like protein